jgi:hypothetical protein
MVKQFPSQMNRISAFDKHFPCRTIYEGYVFNFGFELRVVRYKSNTTDHSQASRNGKERFFISVVYIPTNVGKEFQRSVQSQSFGLRVSVLVQHLAPSAPLPASM